MPKYSMVTFHRIPYATAQQRGQTARSNSSRLCEGIHRVEELDWNKAELLIDARTTPLELLSRVQLSERAKSLQRRWTRRIRWRTFRERFFIPKDKNGEECIYLCGHSLGTSAEKRTFVYRTGIARLGHLGVEGHFHAKNPWMPYHELLAEQTAALVGAMPAEVVVMNSLTVNLHLMMASFYRPTTQRHKILIEGRAFPSDQYAVKSQIPFHGFDPATSFIELTPRDGEFCMRTKTFMTLIEREGDSIALILLGGVNYATGQAIRHGRDHRGRPSQGMRCSV